MSGNLAAEEMAGAQERHFHIRWEDILGHGRQKEELRRLLSQGRLPHALLLSGPEIQPDRQPDADQVHGHGAVENCITDHIVNRFQFELIPASGSIGDEQGGCCSADQQGGQDCFFLPPDEQHYRAGRGSQGHAQVQPGRVLILVKNELPLLTIISGVFFILMNDQLFGRKENGLSRQDAVILICAFICFLIYLVFAYIHNKPKPRGRPPKAKYKLGKAIILIIVSLIAIAIASDMVVDNAVVVAEKLGISQKFIAMTAIVIGTSLPELVMTITAAKKGEFELAVGNIIGTNIFNICIVLGLPTLIFGGFSSSAFNFIDMLAVIIAAASYYIFGYSNKKLSRAEGVIMVSIFAVYYIYVILS